MSRSRYPRVASRTRPKPTRPQLVKLPPLLYATYDRDGELMSVNETDDPRSRICSYYNELNNDLGNGHYALPIVDDIKPARQPRRKAVAQ